ncbi:MAG: sugar ABC transporter ATP-binding protein, partial [Eubacteriales bacterium]|nr:sugar ABC transporter ATP-binding protein [Eubacteriales bacterium]
MGNRDNNRLMLSMQNVSKCFPGTLAVDSVNFDVEAGEVHALVGENGAGKSTLMKLLAGSFNDYTGQVFIDGEEVKLHTPAQSKALGVGMIYQELSLARPISIAENLLVGRLPTRGFLIDDKEVRRQAKDLLAKVGLENLDPDLPVSAISQCEAQLVEIAKSLGDNPKILVMDEPTSALSSEEVRRLFLIIKQLKAQGIAVIYISHHLQEVFEVSDRVTILRDGRKQGTFRTNDISKQEMTNLMVGRSVDEFYADHDTSIGKEMFRVENLSRWGFFHHVSFSVKAGETVAICGLAGSGRTEFARAVIGIDQYDEGKIFLEGKEVRFDNMYQAIQSGVVYLTERRNFDGLAPKLTAGENIMSAHIPDHSRGIFYKASDGLKDIEEMIDALNIVPALSDRQVINFSGGNQQKILMAKWLTTNPKVLILDEPTRGVDIGAKETIHKAIDKLAGQGSAIILITSDLPEMAGLSDRAIILRNGHVIGEIPKEGIVETELLMAANGE